MAKFVGGDDPICIARRLGRGGTTGNAGKCWIGRQITALLRRLRIAEFLLVGETRAAG